MGVCWGHGRAFTFTFSASAACLFSTLNSHRFSCHGVTWDSHGAATIQSSRVHDEENTTYRACVFCWGWSCFCHAREAGGVLSTHTLTSGVFCFCLGIVSRCNGRGKDIRVRENLSTSIGSTGGVSGDCAFALMEKESGSHRPSWDAMQ